MTKMFTGQQARPHTLPPEVQQALLEALLHTPTPAQAQPQVPVWFWDQPPQIQMPVAPWQPVQRPRRSLWPFVAGVLLGLLVLPWVSQLPISITPYTPAQATIVPAVPMVNSFVQPTLAPSLPNNAAAAPATTNNMASEANVAPTTEPTTEPNAAPAVAAPTAPAAQMAEAPGGITIGGTVNVGSDGASVTSSVAVTNDQPAKADAQPQPAPGEPGFKESFVEPASNSAFVGCLPGRNCNPGVRPTAWPTSGLPQPGEAGFRESFK